MTLLPEWVPRDVNVLADEISKTVDYDDWTTTRDFFAYMDSLWGPHTVDRFADSFNTKLSPFNSRFLVPGTESVNALSISWEGETNWLVPPLHCIVQTIQHIIASRARGTLIVPFWPSSGFWPFLFHDAFSPHSFVKETLVFPCASGIFSLGNYKLQLVLVNLPVRFWLFESLSD